jgi:hypothetical protein
MANALIAERDVGGACCGKAAIPVLPENYIRA